MENISSYRKFSYGSRMGFWRIYKFCINLHDWSYIPCYTNQKFVKPGRWTNYATQTGNCHETLSIKPMCFILCVVQNSTAHVNTKALNMRHKSQKGFRGIFFEISQH